MKLIVGLGNPGRQYQQTRHNTGFLVIDRLSQEKDWLKKNKIKLLKPDTFMNRSGEAVQKTASFYKLAPKDIIIIHDDADLPLGEIKIQAGRSSAGHNGVQSIIDSFNGSLDFLRVRIGIGRPENAAIPLEVYVLERWSPEQTARLDEVVEEALQKVKKMVF